MFLLSQLMLATVVRGIALAEVGRIEDGIAVLQHGIDMCEKFGALWRVGVLYNCLGYCHSEIQQPERAWNLNLKSEEVARGLMAQHPMGTRMWAEIISHASVNLMENLFDQGKPHEAWDRMKAFEEESRSQDFDMARLYWELRMKHLAARILLHRNDLDQSRMIIEENLKRARQKKVKKRIGGFLRLLGEVQMRQGETDSAIAYLNEAVISLRELDNPRQLWQAHASLASAFDKLGRFSEGREQWGAAAKVIHNLAEGLSDREFREGFLQAESIRWILSKGEK
jgi:tetratricopeptide (TPR) repeat protein